ncbi:hypothetical protein [Prosthecobacter fluviatilis]|uniref:Uncharacterized protein n=1 Tax=Prosthecobacter fluviatilis TaxID=445931 RepID=A0ABW0KY68_9BACT
MAFIFSTSHLPETRVRRPDHLEDEEDEDTMQPMPRAGGVRAFSHLPPARALADSSGPLSARPATPVGRPRRHIEPEDDQDSTQAPVAESDHGDATRAHADYADDTLWHSPRITAQDQPPESHQEDDRALEEEDHPDPSMHRDSSRTRSSGFIPSPQDLRDAFHSTMGEDFSQDDRSAQPYGLRDQRTGQPQGFAGKAVYHDLVYRPTSSPENERDQHEDFFQHTSGTSATRQAPSSPRAPQTFAQSARPAAQPVPKAGQNTFAAPPPPPKTPDQQSQADMARSVLKSYPEDQRLEKAKNLIDLKVQYTLHTQGIPGLQKMVSGEAGFSKNIQTGLLDNYLNGAPKKQYKMSHQDVYDCNIGLNFARSAEFLKALKENTTGTTPKVWTFKANVPAIAGTSATLGNFTAQVDMKVTSHLEQDKNGNWITKWEVSGAFTVNDTYDFDIVDKEAERAVNDMVNGVNQGLYQGRTQAGQLKTLLMSRVPGTGFAVTSDPITFTQTSNQSTAQIITDVGTYPPKSTAPPPSR